MDESTLLFYLDVADDKGSVTNWACEGASPLALTRRGWKKGDLKLGDTIVVDGYRARDGSHFINARRVTFPDGPLARQWLPRTGCPARPRSAPTTK